MAESQQSWVNELHLPRGQKKVATASHMFSLGEDSNITDCQVPDLGQNPEFQWWQSKETFHLTNTAMSEAVVPESLAKTYSLMQSLMFFDWAEPSKQAGIPDMLQE